MTGEFAYVFQQSTDGNGNQSSGQSVDTSEIYWDAKEDLGGGYSMATHLGIGGADRSGETGGTTVYGHNGYIQFTTPYFAIKSGAIRNSDYLECVAGVGGTWVDLNGAMQDRRSTRNQTTIVTKLSDVTFGVSFEGQDQRTYGTPGYGAGYTGTAGGAGQQLTDLFVNYAAGAMVLDAQYLEFNNPLLANGDFNTGSVAKMYRASGNYDFGAAKVGLGMTRLTGTNSSTWGNYMQGVSVPLNATTLTANLQQSRISDLVLTPALNTTRNGYSLQAQYNLSKQTYFILGYNNWLGQNSAVGTGTVDNQHSNNTSLLMVKDF